MNKMVNAIGVEMHHQEKRLRFNDISVSEDFIKYNSTIGANPIKMAGMIDANHVAYTDEYNEPNSPVLKFTWGSIKAQNMIIIGIDPKGESGKAFDVTLTFDELEDTLLGYPVKSGN